MAAEYTWVKKELRVVKFESARSPERYRSNWVRLLLSTWANQVGNVSAEGHLGMGQLLGDVPGHRADGVVQNGDELSLSREAIVELGGEGGGGRDEIPEEAEFTTCKTASEKAARVWKAHSDSSTVVENWNSCKRKKEQNKQNKD